MCRLPLLMVAISLASGFKTAQASQPADTEDRVQRGAYLVHHVAMCIQCHSPRDGRGELMRTRLLQGAPIPVRPPFPTQPWAFTAPRIAGLPGWRDEDAIELLETGRDARGWSPRPPMPPFRMSPEDAAAVVAYLKSLR